MLEDGFFIHDAYTAKIESLKTFIEFSKASNMLYAEAEKNLETLLLERPSQKTQTVEEEAKSVQATCTGRTRIITQSELWKEQLTKKKTKATTEITRYQ